MLHRFRWGVILLIVVSVIFSVFMVALAQDEPSMTEEEMLERGAYLAQISGCIACHTPYQAEYADFSALTLEQIQTLSLAGEDAQDLENSLMAGGRPFDLGPMGAILTSNLTPDEETGLGSWTDEEIEAAIRIGVSKDGYRLFPIMPYINYFNMAESDMQSLIAYLRSIPAVENEVPRIGPSGEGIAPELEITDELPQNPPDGSDPVELGRYLVLSVMSCSDCHTPLDPETGAPMFDFLLAGGQAYEGPWGIVYGGNITPHEETGLGNWTDEEIARVFREGVRIDGRRLILMPWQDYAPATDEDLNAVIAFLRELTPIENEVPAPSIEDALLIFAEEE